jgi:transposase
MGFPRGMRRDRAALEQRRMQAAQLLEQGHSEAEVARRLGVHRQSVNRWVKALGMRGRNGLRRATRAGRRPKLSDGDLAGLEQYLKQAPEQFGYSTGPWTLARVRQLIEQQYGVWYDPSQVWRILRKLNWSCQRPTGWTRERDEKAIRRWQRRRWPQLNKKPAARDTLSSSSTKAD